MTKEREKNNRRQQTRSNPLKNVMVYVEDLASTMQFAGIIHAPHSADPLGKW